MKKFAPVLTLLVLLVVFSSFFVPQKGNKAQKQIRVAFYNVENLFDTLDDARINDEEYLPNSRSQWTAQRYQVKLNKLAKVISALGVDGQAPDVLGICEVENRAVIEDLIKTDALRAHNYQIVHFDSPDNRGIDVALIYKKGTLELVRVHKYAINMPEDTSFKTRDILMVSAKVGKEVVHFYVNHFPSRTGGQEESEHKRIFVANTLRNSVDSVLRTNGKSNIVIMGDFNDMPHDKSIKDVLNTTGSLDSLVAGKLYNPYLNLHRQGLGTYNYRGNWNMLDQMMVSQGLVDKKGVDYKSNSASILAEDWMKQTEGNYAGYPDRTYAGSRYLGGYSDHFPIYVDLIIQKP